MPPAPTKDFGRDKSNMTKTIHELEISTEGCSKHRLVTSRWGKRKILEQFVVPTEEVEQYLAVYQKHMNANKLQFKVIRKDLS